MPVGESSPLLDNHRVITWTAEQLWTTDRRRPEREHRDSVGKEEELLQARQALGGASASCLADVASCAALAHERLQVTASGGLESVPNFPSPSHEAEYGQTLAQMRAAAARFLEGYRRVEAAELELKRRLERTQLLAEEAGAKAYSVWAAAGHHMQEHDALWSKASQLEAALQDAARRDRPAKAEASQHDRLFRCWDRSLALQLLRTTLSAWQTYLEVNASEQAQQRPAEQKRHQNVARVVAALRGAAHDSPDVASCFLSWVQLARGRSEHKQAMEEMEASLRRHHEQRVSELEAKLRKAADDAEAASHFEHKAHLVDLQARWSKEQRTAEREWRARLADELEAAELDWRCRGFHLRSALLAWRRLAAEARTAEAAERHKFEALQLQQQQTRAQISEIERFLGDRELSELRQRVVDMTRELEDLRRTNAELRLASVQAGNCGGPADSSSPSMAQRLTMLTRSTVPGGACPGPRGRRCGPARGGF